MLIVDVAAHVGLLRSRFLLFVRPGPENKGSPFRGKSMADTVTMASWRGKLFLVFQGEVI